jgi:hypothetical protein
VSIEFTELPGWKFEIDEISAGVYKVRGKNKSGRNVEATGVDPDTLIDECKKSAKQIVIKSDPGGRT